MSEPVRVRVREALLAIYLAIAPSTVPSWRLLPTPVPAITLAVGEPTPSLAVRPRRDDHAAR